MSLVWSPRSIADVEAIRTYIAHDSPFYAALVVRRIVRGVARLERFPESGRVVPELAQESLREIIVRPYRIVYRVRGGSIEIVTVFHAARLLRDIS